MAIVVITGCSSGIGFESALAFARRGDRVHACVRSAEKGGALTRIAESEGLDIQIETLDVMQSSSFPNFVETVVARSGRIDVLVNNAGILFPGAWEDLTEEQSRAVMETNFFGPMFLSRAVLPQMRKQNSGYIIMISSLSGVAGLAGDVAYSASKFALEGATEALRHEVDRWNIRLALVQGGRYATNIFRSDGDDVRQADSTSNASTLPLAYPIDSPYKGLVEFKQQQIRDGAEEAISPQVLAAQLLTIADSDGAQLRWPSDELAQRVLGAVHAQSDAERDAFLCMAGGSQWWSAGLSQSE